MLDAGTLELLMAMLTIRMMTATSLSPGDDCDADKMRSLWSSQRFSSQER